MTVYRTIPRHASRSVFGQKGVAKTAGDGAQQLQVENLTIVNGIDEKRAREIVDERLHELMSQYSQEAHKLTECRYLHLCPFAYEVTGVYRHIIINSIVIASCDERTVL